LNSEVFIFELGSVSGQTPPIRLGAEILKSANMDTR